jgi:hypothetical protein
VACHVSPNRKFGEHVSDGQCQALRTAAQLYALDVAEHGQVRSRPPIRLPVHVARVNSLHAHEIAVVFGVCAHFTANLYRRAADRSTLPPRTMSVARPEEGSCARSQPSSQSARSRWG